MFSKRKYLLSLLILFIPILLFFKSFSAYFSQDDFFHLRASQGNLISDFNKFFSFSPIRGYAFYRPLSREVYHNLMWRLFGLNPFPFHLFQFLVFILNVFLLNKFLSKIFPNQFRARILTIIFYETSAIHLGTFYYLGSFQILLSTSFILLTLSFFFKKNYLLSFFFFFLSLLCHEISYLTPILLLIIVMIKEKGKKAIKFTIPFLFLATLFFWLNMTLIKLPDQIPYLPKFSLKGIINSLAWYILWGVGVPEHMLDYIGPGLKINHKIILQFPIQFWLMVIFFILFTLFLVIMASNLIYHQSKKTTDLSVDELLSLRGNFCRAGQPHSFDVKLDEKIPRALPVELRKKNKKRNSRSYKELLLAIVWFLVTVSFFLILPAHRFVYYLILPEIGICLAVASIISRKLNVISYLIVIFYLVVNVNTIKWGEQTYWALGRSRLAEKLTTQIKKAYPSLPHKAALYLKDDRSYISPNADWGGTAKQAYLALSGSDGIQMLYNDLSLKVYYETGLLPSSTDRVFEFVVKAF